MATPRVFNGAVPGTPWTNVIGGAANIAGMTWQNVGSTILHIAFTTAAPGNPGSATDAFHILRPGEAFYDANGSAALWARSVGNGAGSISGTSD